MWIKELSKPIDSIAFNIKSKETWSKPLEKSMYKLKRGFLEVLA